MKKKSFKRKTELFDAALEEFTTKNFEDASLNRILRNAGISKGTFYYHFQDKQSLYLFILESLAKTKREFVRKKIKEYAVYQEKDIFDKFMIQARIGVEFATRYPKYYQLNKMFLREKGNRIYDIAKSRLGFRTEKALEEMIKEAIKKGDFKAVFPEKFLIKTISYLFVHFDEIFCEEEDVELQKRINNLGHFVQFMRGGLGRDGSERKPSKEL